MSSCTGLMMLIGAAVGWIGGLLWLRDLDRREKARERELREVGVRQSEWW